MNRPFFSAIRTMVREALHMEWEDMVEDLIERKASIVGGEAGRKAAEETAKKIAQVVVKQESSLVINRKLEETARTLAVNLHSKLPEEVNRLFMGKIQVLYQLNPANQYLIVVKDEQTAEDLVKACSENFDLGNGPRIVFVVADRINVVEIVK